MWHQPKTFRWAQTECGTLPSNSVKAILAISQVHTISSGLALLSLSNLVLVWNNYVMYLQILHALQTVKWLLKPITSPPFQKCMYSPTGSKGGLSKMY